MTINQLRYSKEEFARRGNEIYQSQVRSQVEEGNHGKIVAIDIETGAFEVTKDSLTTSDQLLARLTYAQIWFVRIGHRAVHRVGLIGANLFQ
ncbi:hypothetical protein PN437_06795 [Microcystis aeruginosa CS-564/01]|uniref:hypothetical protein n=1 Tax=Microcystis aeruginosa TaxID=1126 RepID=UPI00232E3C04|nr:hypothetical protein [Microcystis aeruginosa]MDB9424616.1 hypothetical protein [Microcystis aeruginosa CS-564/01]